MFVVVDELDGGGNTSPTTIQTDQISSIKASVIDYSSVCKVCLVEGGRVARHDYAWCKTENRLDEFHERQQGPSDVTVTIISMYNGDTIIVKGSPQLVALV